MAWLPLPVLNQQTPLTLLALALVPLLAWGLNRTPLGLAVRMVGENPAAVEGQGLSVLALRSGAILAGSALMAVAGAFLTLSAFNAFYFNMVNGRGWVCVALVVFASWRPAKALAGALLFAFFDALQLRLQQAGGGVAGIELPYQLYLMLPYVMAIVALVVVARRASYPQALMMKGEPYRKGTERTFTAENAGGPRRGSRWSGRRCGNRASGLLVEPVAEHLVLGAEGTQAADRLALHGRASQARACGPRAALLHQVFGPARGKSPRAARRPAPARP